MCNTCNMAYKAYVEALRHFGKVYLEVEKPLYEAYRKARDPFEEVYQKALNNCHDDADTVNLLSSLPKD